MMLMLAWRRAPTNSGEQNRHAILEHVRGAPGANLREIGRATGLSQGSVGHHVAVLRRERKVQLRRRLRQVCVFSATLTEDEVLLATLLHDPVARGILLQLGSSPSLGAQDLSRILAVSRKTVRRHLAVLEGAGLVASDGGYHPRFSAAERLENDLALLFGPAGRATEAPRQFA